MKTTALVKLLQCQNRIGRSLPKCESLILARQNKGVAYHPECELVIKLAELESLQITLRGFCRQEERDEEDKRKVGKLVEECENYFNSWNDAGFAAGNQLLYRCERQVQALDIASLHDIADAMLALGQEAKKSEKNHKDFRAELSKNVIDELKNERFVGIYRKSLEEIKEGIKLRMHLEHCTRKLERLKNSIQQMPDAEQDLAEHIANTITAAEESLKKGIRIPRSIIQTRIAQVEKILDALEPPFFVTASSRETALTILGTCVAWLLSIQHYLFTISMVFLVILAVENMNWPLWTGGFLTFIAICPIFKAFQSGFQIETPYFSVSRSGESLSSLSEFLLCVCQALFALSTALLLSQIVLSIKIEQLLAGILVELVLAISAIVFFGISLRHSRVQVFSPLDKLRHRMYTSKRLRESLELPLEETKAKCILADRDFSGKNLKWIRLRGIEFKNCDFRAADFGQSDLTDSRFENCNLTDATFSDANLKRAVFHDCSGLRAEQFKGAILQGSELPTALKLPAVESVNESAKEVANQSYIMLIACLTTCIILAFTSDVALLVDKVSLPIPVLNVSEKISVNGFFVVAPILLIAVFLYFQLSLQKLWHRYVAMPVVFPDGTKLEDRTSNWLLGSIAYEAMPRTALPSWLTFVAAHLSLWLVSFAVPLSILFLTFRYLATHDILLSLCHAVAVGIAVFIGIFSLLSTRKTLRNRLLHAEVHLRSFFRSLGYAIATSAILTLVACIAIFGRGTQIPCFYANLESAEIAVRPSDWDPLSSPKMFHKIPVVDLSGMNLRFMSGQRAFLPNADLTGSDLSMADLCLARMQGTMLIGTDLPHARLIRASLDEGEVYDADFRFAHLQEAGMTYLNINAVRNLPEPNSFQRQMEREHDDEIVESAREIAWSKDSRFNASPARLAEKGKARFVIKEFSDKFAGLIYDTDFSYADLSNADVRDSVLDHCCFLSATLEGTDFQDCRLNNSNFYLCRTQQDRLGPNFCGAHLEDATFESVVFSNASFNGSYLANTNFKGAHFQNCDFRNVQGLLPEQIAEAHVKSCWFSSGFVGGLEELFGNENVKVEVIEKNFVEGAKASSKNAGAVDANKGSTGERDAKFIYVVSF